MNVQTVRLKNQLKALQGLERDIVWMLSVVCQPIDVERLVLCLQAVLKQTDPAVRIDLASIQSRLRRLVRKGLVIEWQGTARCRPDILELAMRAVSGAGLLDAFAGAVRRIIPVVRSWNGNYAFDNYDQALREIRLALYSHNARDLNSALENASRAFPVEVHRRPPLYMVTTSPFEREWFEQLPMELQSAAICSILPLAGRTLRAEPECLALIEETLPRQHPVVRLFLADYYALLGRFQDALRTLDGLATAPARMRLGRLSFLEGKDEQALVLFRDALHELRSQTRNGKAFFETISGLFFIFALLEEGSEISLSEAELCARAGLQESLWRETYGHLLQVIRAARGEHQDGSVSAVNAGQVYQAVAETAVDLPAFFRFLFDYWLDPRSLRDEITDLERLHRRAREQGFGWVAAETADMLDRLGVPDPDSLESARALYKDQGIRSLVALVRVLEPWRRALKELGEIGSRKPVSDEHLHCRLAWQLTNADNPAEVCIHPVEQRLNTKGKWTRGRAVPLRRLWRPDERPDYFTDQDRRVCNAIEIRGDAWAHGSEPTDFVFDRDRALPELVGHPNLFWENQPETAVELISGSPQLLVEAKDSRLYVRLTPEFGNGARTVVVRETPTRLKVIRMSLEHARMREILGTGLAVPVEGMDELRRTMDQLAPHVIIQSDISSDKPDAETRDGDPTPHIHLLPAGEGLEVEMLVMPLGPGGPSCVPGKGGSTLITGFEMQRIEVRRDLLEETALAERVLGACRILNDLSRTEWTWELESPEECLELLLELKSLDSQAVVEWPEGQTFSLAKQVSFEDLSLYVTRKRDWFSVSGDVMVNEDLTLSLSELIRLNAQTGGRFVRIAEGHFLALTDTFRKKLEELGAVGDVRRKDIRLHPFASGLVEEIHDEVATFEADEEWTLHLDRTAAAFTYTPEIPSTFMAELRDYQREGFIWLARLAEWGAGACLADDMGLGKTVQALALILLRAGDGPSLVVAPTSVCLNWAAETRRFAPTLRPLVFGQGDRSEMLRSLGPFDLVIASYGLMQSEVLSLERIVWQTVVLDEAQAIKNPRAKRSLAAVRLQGNFRMVTTGTPIENHLGELWSLFRFLNPGLLGTREMFMSEFAVPIERDADVQIRRRLKRLVQSFILRRTKSQVLEELPARTDILHHVELDEKERAFYEALRRQSLVNLQGAGSDTPQKRFKILAEITRLRQACCNPRLIVGDAKIPSAKLEAFDAILEELLESRHRALVFSQFVRHLALLREHLDAKSIRYQYLDGSTPAKERAERVEAFQRGVGDVFLISLKAGGTGLNLTAADYVIHMDPWWNPAVEDQASDRAHRIGQLRPVTIYRLVAKDTIEDKIVDLHQHKRDLADSLLEGTDIPSHISTDELLRLLASH